ncbi:hypothetical protein M378DRAFT_83308 [Amanita muscaria Koide BX008]|uniref:Glutamate--tRNA ligase, mitochondrial n=1 Tax=Amanita muscaria (strain Koide BX008) TaxID=946122 RepID=A0A0C2WVE7_AMAMK|nr:hypothetical protein M378DRAFT_83308 [Amanita muscaria Koide BX008]
MALLRFAPSPTGPLHLGGLRMALYNYLYAKKTNGKWILRIEDTDATRFVPGAVDGIRGALQWAGLEYDYGPGKEGPHAPYYQSERRDLYQTYAKNLLESGHAYRCFCTQDTLTETREKLARSGSNLTYDKRCLHLTDEEVARRLRAGHKSTIRLNDTILPDRQPTQDLVFGDVRDAHLSLSTDPILLKSDLFPTYHLASVVDDYEMGITHVLRGEEWLPSLPLHLDLYACLKLPSPQFAHIPILLNPDGTKMSKRNGDVQVIDFIRRGWEPEAILNWLALAGWGARHKPASPSSSPPSPPLHWQTQQAPDSTQIMTVADMIAEFDLTVLTHRSTSLDPGKLEYINKQHVARASSTPEGLHELAERVHEQVKTAFPHCHHTNIENIKRVISLLEGRLTNIRDIPKHAPYLFIDPDLSTDEAGAMLKRVTPEQRTQALSAMSSSLRSPAFDSPESWTTPELHRLLHEEQKRSNVPLKPFMTTIRHALTGMKDGPAIVDIMHFLGRDRTLERFN